VGKTTCAAAIALRSASRRRTLLVSTDPAAALRRLSTVHPVPGLEITHVDAGAALGAWLQPRKDLLATIALRGTYLDADDVNRLLALSLPGIDEAAALLEIVHLSTSTHTRVVIDTAPTGHTLRLLGMPALYERVAAALDAMQSHHREVVSALTGRYQQDAADRLIAGIARDASDLMARLRDPRGTAFIWVTLPEPMALEETADAIGALRASGISVRTLVVNRATPSGGCEWDDVRRRFEARALWPVAERFPGLDVRTVPDMPAEPRGAASLKTLGRACRRFRARVRPAPLRRRVYGSLGAPVSPLPVSADVFDAGWLLFGGKGGVGKTTCSASVALDLARSFPRERFLLLSTDPAHSLGDALGAAVDDTARAVPGGPPNLDVREIDAEAGFARFRRKYLDTIDHDAFRELIDLAPPGIDEVMAVADVAELLATDGGYRTVIADTAPTGHGLRLLETPSVLRAWTQALMAVLLKYREIVRAGEFARSLVDLSRRLRLLDAALRDPSRTAFIIVTRPAAGPRDETLGLHGALQGLGVPVRAVIVNAVGAGTCGRCQALVRRQLREVERLRPLGGREGCAIIEAPSVLPPPHGVAVLLEWRSRWRPTQP
jgi:arsenite-transporting ATPase